MTVMEEVLLKNGTKEAKVLVDVVMLSVRNLLNSGISGITALYDLVQICRNNPNYQKFGNNEETLKKLSLLQDDGKPHSSVRNIILSSVSGDGINMAFESPVKK